VVKLPETYIVNKFYQYAGSPKHNRGTNVYQASCPICREGKSWLRKKRCYYIPTKNVIHCHNCGWHGNPVNWIMELQSCSLSDVLSESNNYDDIVIPINQAENNKKITNYELPCDCIDLENDDELNFYSNNSIVMQAVFTLNDRGLLTSINRPKKYYITLTDFVHKNRIIIPFYDENNKIIFYQSRKILNNDDRPRYLSKKNSERSIFNINNIIEDIPYVFITEGPFDCTFIRNGIALAGISESGSDTFTEKQKLQIQTFPLHEHIFVLDNQWNDATSKKKSKDLIEAGKSVFLWPKEYGKFKDINDVCVRYKLNEFPYKFILKNSFSGMVGKLKLSEIR
jgi:hypothetical protein